MPSADGKDDEDDKEADDAAAGDEAGKSMSDEEAKRKIANDVKEFLAVKDISEGKLALEDLPAPRRSEFIDKIFGTVLERKESEVQLVCELLKAAREAQLLSDEDVVSGLKETITMLDDISVDAPQAFKFAAMVLHASGLPDDKIQTLADGMEGEGITPPSAKLMKKLAEVREA